MGALVTSNFLNLLGAALISGDTRSPAQRFTTPTPVYINDDLMVLGSTEIAEEAMQIMFRGLSERGITELVARVVASELPRGPMQKVWADWDYLNAQGKVVAYTRSEYVLRAPDAPQLTMIEMVNHIDFAFPEIVARLPLSR